MRETDVLVVGAGAAGMMAAAVAARAGASVLLLEKTARPGFKIGISGGGRCNVTTALDDPAEILGMIPGNGRFLRDALRAHPPDEILALLARHGVKTRVEIESRKRFPVSDRSQDVISALLAELREAGVVLRLSTPVSALHVRAGACRGVVLADGEIIEAGAVILCVGGKSLPRSGSTGDGYEMVERVGHTVSPLFPSLVPLRTAGTRELAGVALRDVEGRARVAGQPAGRSFRGDMLFTHTGLSGPIVLQLSRALAAGVSAGQSAALVVDLMPDIPRDRLLADLTARVAEAGKSQAASLLRSEVPKAVGPVILEAAGIDPGRKAAELGKKALGKLVEVLKGWTFPVTGWHSFEVAEVTAGGVSLGEVDPRTFASRVVPGLYFAGEILDLDGFVGGFNFQIAWSSGAMAGEAAAAYVREATSP